MLCFAFLALFTVGINNTSKLFAIVFVTFLIIKISVFNKNC